MAAVRTDPVLRFIRKLAVRDRAVHLTDCELLQAFVTRHDDDAFAALVGRHGAMVLRVCRNVLHNEHDAEDAFQATFLVLSRKAASVQKQQSVGSWLFGVAQRVATNLQRNRGRQRTRDSRIGQIKTVDPLADISVREAQAILYEELNRLPEKYRSPLVLCTLEGMTRDEAAHHLGLPLHTLKNRLEWARKRLRERLAARGVGLLGALIGSVFCEQAGSAAVPMTLLNSTINAATTVATVGAATSVVSAKVAALTEGVLKTMFFTKLKTAMAMLLLVGMLGTGVGTVFLTSGTQAAESANEQQSLLPKDPQPREAEKPKDNRDKLQGIWKGEIVELFGLSAKNPDGPWKVDLRIEGDRLTLRGPVLARGITSPLAPLSIAVDNEFTFKVNSQKVPAEIDLTRKPDPNDPDDEGLPRVVLGVFVLKGDTLQVCLGLERKPRPTELKTRDLAFENADPKKYPDVLLVLNRAAGAKWEQLPKAKERPPLLFIKGDKDSDRLQGAWKATAAIGNGQPVPNEQLPNIKIVFTGEKMTFFPPEGDTKPTLKFTFDVDTTKKPKVITVTRLTGGLPQKSGAGIYAFDGDTLKLCLPIRQGKEAPTEFAAPENSGLIMMTLKKSKG